MAEKEVKKTFTGMAGSSFDSHTLMRLKLEPARPVLESLYSSAPREQKPYTILKNQNHMLSLHALERASIYKVLYRITSANYEVLVI
jgi:hypothetical protein